MSKWHSLLEILQFPLKMLFIGTLLLGIGTAVLNPNVTFLWQIDHPVLIQVFELLRYMGASIIYFFPFLVFIHILSHRTVWTHRMITGSITRQQLTWHRS